jgi:23S rRNA (adenine-N6)-dimethyltransferase
MKRRHEYSQHFLRNQSLVNELIGHSNIKKTDTVIDIGAGSGSISYALAPRAANVIAIENEPRTARLLRNNIGAISNITIIEDDFLHFTLPQHQFKVFSNIPFNLSAEIVRRLTDAQHAPSDTYLIVQKQFAKKLLIDGDEFTGMLGAQIAPWFTPRIRRPLKRKDFTPPPNVDTVLLHIAKRSESLLPPVQQVNFNSFVERCFHDQVYFAKLALPERHQIDKARPSLLTSSEWIQLFNAVKPIVRK